jgi:hypothetical protein
MEEGDSSGSFSSAARAFTAKKNKKASGSLSDRARLSLTENNYTPGEDRALLVPPPHNNNMNNNNTVSTPGLDLGTHLARHDDQLGLC